MDKEHRRAKRAVERREREAKGGSAGDPDLEGMVAGPQPGQVIDLP